MDERPVLICSTVESLPEPVEGSTRGHYCEVCAAELWRSPSSDELPDNVVTMCALCAIGVMETESEVQIMPVTERQRREVHDYYRRKGGHQE
jgi:hypothetical protein